MHMNSITIINAYEIWLLVWYITPLMHIFYHHYMMYIPGSIIISN